MTCSKRAPLFDHIAGVIFGTAIGDAMGYPLEFSPVAERVKRFKRGVADYPTLVGGIAQYSDDTQMMRAVLEGCIQVEDRYDAQAMGQSVAAEFVRWSRSPENNRAPGSACMAGCRNLESGAHWELAGGRSALGSGAAMRSMAYGLLFPDKRGIGGTMAAQHALMTHGHPGAQEASFIVAKTIELLRKSSSDIQKLMMDIFDAAGDYSTVTALDIYNNIYKAIHVTTTKYNFQKAMEDLPGWRSDHAVAAALLCFIGARGYFERTISDAVVYCGDADTVGAIAGSFAGAYAGYERIPQRFVDRIEDKDGLLDLAERVTDKVMYWVCGEAKERCKRCSSTDHPSPLAIDGNNSIH